MKAATVQETAREVLDIVQQGIRSTMPAIEKAAAEMGRFDRAFRKEQKRIREKLYGGIRRSKTDPV